MVSRREATAGMLVAGSSFFTGRPSWGASTDEDAPFFQLTFPLVDSIQSPQKFGYKEPDEKQKAKAAEMVRTTPKGPRPLDIAQSFVDRFYASDPESISQWPEPSAWNPLVVEFFSATDMQARDDMVAWCAAFVNWCLERGGRKTSHSAASQSFLGRAFKNTADPQIGDLAVFTCHDKTTDKSLGLGHVTFVKEKPVDGRVKVVGGNQSKDGHASVISETSFPLGNRQVFRHIEGKYVACNMRLNTFVSVL